MVNDVCTGQRLIPVCMSSLAPRPIRGEEKGPGFHCVRMHVIILENIMCILFLRVPFFPECQEIMCMPTQWKPAISPRSGNQPFLHAVGTSHFSSPRMGLDTRLRYMAIIQFNEDVCSLTTRMSCVSLVMNHSCEFLYSPAESERNLMSAYTLASPSLTHEPTPISPPLTHSPIPPLTPSPISPLSLSLPFPPSHSLSHLSPLTLTHSSPLCSYSPNLSLPPPRCSLIPTSPTSLVSSPFPLTHPQAKGVYFSDKTSAVKTRDYTFISQHYC